MFCGFCGGKLDSSGMCTNCVKPAKQPEVPPTPTNSNKNNKKMFVATVIIVGVFSILALVLFLSAIRGNGDDKKRSETLVNLEKNEYLKFTLGEDEFYIGDKISTYRSKNYSYDERYIDENAKVKSDSIMSQTFYNELDDAQFLGAMYCPAGDECLYDDTSLIKINFYEESDVVVNDYIKFGMSYDDIVEKYGKEDGTFYQDSDLLVWTFGEKGKIGEPYYILRFDNGGIWSLGDLYEIRIGVWWYEGEYEHTVIKDKDGDK